VIFSRPLLTTAVVAAAAVVGIWAWAALNRATHLVVE